MFNSFSSIIHTVLIGSLAYLAIVIALRITGKRTLSKWNAFDFVVTVAYGSILANLALTKDTSLLQGLLGLGVLLGLQFLLTWLTSRSSLIRSWVKAEPTLLLSKGVFQADAMLQERITESEVCAAARAKGIASLERIEAVVLETDGSFSIIQDPDQGSHSAMADVRTLSPVVEGFVRSSSPEPT